MIILPLKGFDGKYLIQGGTEYLLEEPRRFNFRVRLRVRGFKWAGGNFDLSVEMPP